MIVLGTGAEAYFEEYSRDKQDQSLSHNGAKQSISSYEAEHHATCPNKGLETTPGLTDLDTVLLHFYKNRKKSEMSSEDKIKHDIIVEYTKVILHEVFVVMVLYYILKKIIHFGSPIKNVDVSELMDQKAEPIDTNIETIMVTQQSSRDRAKTL